ncbi:MAG: hypothetical protein GY696_24395, partial [Gammaproteobacteria bacterium]|nr:hypothetical protein [Gammaproteobacteria bacterium]
YQNLGHQLNLGLHFCRQFKARISYEGDQPCIEIQGEKHLLVDSRAAEQGGGMRGQLRDPEPAQTRKNLDRSSNPQLRTFVKLIGNLGLE